MAAVAGKKSFLPFQKFNFENSANCGVIKIYFSEPEKVLFCCHCYHQQKYIHLLFNALQNALSLSGWRGWSKKEFFRLPEI
ncbi:MAG: hypothetical protein H6Q15_2141 [Bacteroidetes bacterium]|nr:hypothetical protein [Bacteroidota bacterium]